MIGHNFVTPSSRLGDKLLIAILIGAGKDTLIVSRPLQAKSTSERRVVEVDQRYLIMANMVMALKVRSFLEIELTFLAFSPV